MALDAYASRTRSGGRKSNFTLSSREYTKITGTIASVRRKRQELGDENGSPREERFNMADEPSFTAETSFVRAPLNSRVVSGAGVNGVHRAVRGGNSVKGKGKEKVEPLERAPTHIQEAFILEDLLFVLTGIEGTYIRYHDDYSAEDEDPLQGVRFAISSQLDPSIRDMTERILPLATYYTSVCAFIEARSHLDFGLVNHALCAAIRDMLKDYQTLLSQLEHAYTTSSTFSLQKLWFYIHPTSHTLSLLYALVLELSATYSSSVSDDEGSSSSEDEEERKRNEALGLNSDSLKAILRTSSAPTITSTSIIPILGGEVLTVLYELASRMSGDPGAKELFGALIEKSSKPYVRLICRWVGTGTLADRWEEVCIKEKSWVNRKGLEIEYEDGYWEERYTLRDGSVLSKQDSPQHVLSVPAPRTPGGRLPGGACIPPPLERWKHKVLLAGKYLNVIRECGIDIGNDGAEAEDNRRTVKPSDMDEWGMTNPYFHAYLDQAYTYANTALLSLLVKKMHLLPRLRTLKRYFFLSQSSYLTHYLDLAASELRKSVRSVSVGRLQSLLEMALREGNVAESVEDSAISVSTSAASVSSENGGTTQGAKEFKEDLKVTMASSGLYEWLLKVVSVSGVIGNDGDGGGKLGSMGGGASTGGVEDKDDKEKKPLLAIDALALDYTVPFPVSLILSRKTMLRYQLVFRFLLHLKHVEQSLCAMFIEHTTTAWRTPTTSVGSGSFHQWRLRVFLLRARMLAWVQSIMAFATFEVLEPNWRKLEERLGKVGTVDELLREHTDFLDTCLKECMLTSNKLLRAYSRLIVTCSTFAVYTASFTKSANQALASAAAFSGEGGDQQAMTKRWEFLGKFETNFDHWFKIHLDCVQFYASSENVSLLPLVVKLNSVKGT